MQNGRCRFRERQNCRLAQEIRMCLNLTGRTRTKKHIVLFPFRIFLMKTFVILELIILSKELVYEFLEKSETSVSMYKIFLFLLLMFWFYILNLFFNII